MGVIPRDDNRVPAFDPAYGFRTNKNMVFAGATTNDPGDFNGTGNPATLFTVTGVVRMKLLAICRVNLASTTGTLEIGTAAVTTGLIPQTTATDIDAGEIWFDATPTTTIEPTSSLVDNIVSANVIQTVATADITAGEIDYYALWYPLTEDGNVVAA
jgi:hypothetical protein